MGTIAGLLIICFAIWWGVLIYTRPKEAKVNLVRLVQSFGLGGLGISIILDQGFIFFACLAVLLIATMIVKPTVKQSN